MANIYLYWELKSVSEKHHDAVEFLEKIIKGSKVFFRKDDNLAQESDLVYLYLLNRTFINARLIKSGLVKVDDTLDFKYKKKFLSYYQDLGR